MTWSLALTNGDFTLNGGEYGTVVDEHKLLQDLRCAALEPMGTDSMHPEYGSLIDGGTMLDGTVVPGVIGEDPETAATTIASEIERIAASYQQQQLARAKDDRTLYNRVSLSPAEALISISGIDPVQVNDALFVTITLINGRNEAITTVFPITTNS